MTVRDRVPSGPVTLTGVGSQGGFLYVAGRLAAIVERYHIAFQTVKFSVVPTSVDPFWSGYGTVSHIAVPFRGRTYVYRVRGGHVKDGTLTLITPAFLKLPGVDCPGLRLPTT